MASFNNLNDLAKYVQKDINKVLNKEVASSVEDALIEAVDETIYQSGDPLFYNRRGLSPSSTGLGGREQMYHDPVTNGVLEVTDLAEPSKQWDVDLDSMLVEGYGNKEEWWNKPRDFYETARETLEKHGYHLDAMQEGLNKLGYKVTRG
jgi:hypothetical protein